MANPGFISNIFDVRSELTWTHPAFEERRKDKQFPEHALKAHLLWQRALKHRTKLTQPDAWFSLKGNNLYFEPTPGTQPLRPGDVLQTELVYNLPHITHDCIYVGKGFIVSFARPKGCSLSEGVVQVDRLDQGLFFNKTWRPVETSPDLPCNVRLQRLWRALSCTGHYKYDPIFFNCQNVVSLWLRPHLTKTHSIGARRIASVLVLSTITAACVGVVGLVYHINNKTTTRN